MLVHVSASQSLLSLLATDHPFSHSLTRSLQLARESNVYHILAPPTQDGLPKVWPEIESALHKPCTRPERRCYEHAKGIGGSRVGEGLHQRTAAALLLWSVGVVAFVDLGGYVRMLCM